ncbi:hypothetical protein BC831DRAFT_378700, partial [Entophlyctis helioformis]
RAGYWDAAFVEQYLKKADELLKLLLAMIQTTSGQPARVTELATIKMANSESSIRHVFAIIGQIVLIPTYNKTGALTDKDRPIARFLPLAASRLFYIYLTVIRP